MPTTSNASTLSRHTMKSTCPIPDLQQFPLRSAARERDVPARRVALLRDDHALGALMKVVEELVFTRVQRRDHDERIGARREHFLLAQLHAFEFGGALADVMHFDLDALPRRHLDARRVELAVVHFERSE